MFFKIGKYFFTYFLVSLLISACSSSAQSSKPLSPEAQKRIRDQQEAKRIQDRNNEIRVINSQIQEQNRLEQLQFDKQRAERAAQRNAERETRRAEEEKIINDDKHN
jgi:TolA-binding protein